jgi:hypothetical protein
MAATYNPYFALEADHGQADAVTEAYYNFLDDAADEGLSPEEAEAAWAAR